MSTSHCIYLAANEVNAAGKQRAVLLSSCGGSSYKLIKTILSLNSTADAELIKWSLKDNPTHRNYPGSNAHMKL